MLDAASIARFTLVALALPSLSVPTSAAPPQDKLDAEALIAQAWLRLPTYDGDHRAFLSEGARRDAAVAAHLLDAALELEPAHLRGLWSLGHARILLSEDRRNRGFTDEAAAHHDAAVTALSRAIELQPSDPWAIYARGAAHTAAGQHDAALADLTRAVGVADTRLDAGDDSISWLRFKALEWQPEVHMRLGQHTEAREKLRAFHAEFSNNDWPMLIALAESHLRERDLAGARDRYLEIIERFPNDHQAYGLLGYVAGLLNDESKATARLLEAIAYERQPDMYLRLWLCLLATDEERPAAVEDLTFFVENPPDSLSEWDRALGRFMLGSGTADEFLATARAEEARRMGAGETIDALMCEAWFYAGVRLETDARTEPPRHGATLADALEAHRTALGYAPLQWKWEWAFARVAFARLAIELDLVVGPTFSLAGDQLRVGERTVTVVDGTWHAPGTDRPSADLGREPRPGDLYQARVLRNERGNERGVELVRRVVR